MKRIFNAEIVWDTGDKGNTVAIEALVEYLNQLECIEAITPHVYPENPILIIVKGKEEVSLICGEQTGTHLNYHGDIVGTYCKVRIPCKIHIHEQHPPKT